MAERAGGIAAAEAENLRLAWTRLLETVERIIGKRSTGSIEISHEEHTAVLQGVLLGAPRARPWRA